MIKDLILLANTLDKKGFIKEADFVDALIKRAFGIQFAFEKIFGDEEGRVFVAIELPDGGTKIFYKSSGTGGLSEAGDWVVPLIQAGTWLEGANLVAKIMVKEGKYDAADEFFRQKEIVEYFISYVDRDGKDKAPDGVVKTLSDMLNSFKSISSKPRIEEADVKEIEKLTSQVLALL